MNKSYQIEDAMLRWKNFSGIEKDYNPKGNRNFVVILNMDDANMLRSEGFNVKTLQPRDPQDDPQYSLSIKVKYNEEERSSKDPKVILICGNKKTILDKDSVGSLDYAEIEHADIIIRPYEYDVGGRRGVAAYLQTAYITIVQDAFEEKYSDLDFD